jgi:hypothetical protein
MPNKAKVHSRVAPKLHEARPIPVAPCLPEPERRVALCFRLWMRGYKSGDIACWARAWELYCGRFGVPGARRVVGKLSYWVNTLNRATVRGLEVFPESSVAFCRDECLAVAMIAACQHDICPAMRACAFAFIESSSSVDRVIDTAQAFAEELAGLQEVLSLGSIVTAPGLVAAEPRASGTLRGRQYAS